MNEMRYPLLHLRAWRERREMSQAQLAEAADIGRSTITRLEAGKHAANGITVMKLARGLGIERDDLLLPPPAKEAAQAFTGSHHLSQRAVGASDAVPF